MIPAEIQQTKQRFGIIGNAPGLIRAITRALQIAPIDLAVLITGESGAGKEFFPQIIHANSSRKHGKYIAVNCGAIPEGTIDSELFGHEKGAFTGALSARKGYFEEADGGTIFLDEVGELPLTTQARLLRVLESGEFRHRRGDDCRYAGAKASRALGDSAEQGNRVLQADGYVVHIDIAVSDAWQRENHKIRRENSARGYARPREARAYRHRPLAEVAQI